MRVLHVAEAFGGGIYEIVCNLADGLTRRGYRNVVAYGVRPETPDDIGASTEGVEFVSLGWKGRTPVEHALAAVRLRRLVREVDPDIVHLHSSYAGVIGAAVLRDAPLIYTPNAYASVMRESGSIASSVYRLAEGWASRHATLVGAVSEHEASIAEGYGAAEIRIVANGIPELERDRLRAAPPPARPRVIALGRTVPQRQPEGAARILAAVRDIAEVAWIGGGGGSRGEEGARALSAAGIPLTGWVDHDRVIEELRTSTVYLHWTGWDGLPLSVLEALATDCVVIASDIGPNREILGPEQVCSTEEKAITLLRRVLQDPDQQAAFRASQAARRDRYALTTMVDGWAEVYEDLAGRSDPSA